MKEPHYKLELESKVDREKESYEFVSSDGVQSTETFRESELLLLDSVKIDPEDDILVVQSDIGVLGITADRVPEGRALLTETSARASILSKMNLESNRIRNAEVKNLAFLDGMEGGFDKVLYAPRAYEPVDIARNRIAASLEKVKPGGSIYVSGDKSTGINRFSQMLGSLPGQMEKVNRRKGNKVYRYTKNRNEKVERAEISRKFSTEVSGTEADFKTGEGLFSQGKLDEGTRLLIENIEASGDDKVLDLACGYGAIGVLLGKKYGCEVYLSDDDARATYYARKNMKLNGIENFQTETADCMEGFENEQFDMIVSNPPTHAGKRVIDEMLEESKKKLSEKGSIQLVVNRGLGFENKLQRIYGNAEITAQKDNYQVLKAENLSR